MTVEKLNHLCCYFMLAWGFLPIISVLQSNIVFQLLLISVLLLWIGTAMYLLPNQLRSKLLSPAIAFLLLMYSYVFIGYGNLNIPTSMSYIVLLAAGINGYLYMDKPNLKFDKSLFKFTILFLTMTLLSTIFVLYSDGNAARTLTASSSEAAEIQLLKRQNVGAFDFIYSLVILTPVVFIYSKRAKRKVVVYSLLAGMLFCIVLSNFTTALVLLYLGICLGLLMGQKNMTPTRFVVLLMVLFLITPIFLSFFFQILIEHSTSIYASSKLENLVAMMAGNETVSDATPRTQLLMKSLESFLSNPILGAGAWYSDGRVNPIGQHSQILDELGRYGLIGFCSLFAFVKKPVIRTIHYSNCIPIYRNAALPSVFVFGGLSFLNPVLSTALVLTLLIVLPLFIRYRNEDFIYN